MSEATDNVFGGNVRLHICRPNPIECGVCHGDGTGSDLAFAKPQDRPEPGKVYALTGGADEAAISNGNSWAESEVDPKTGRPAMVFRPDAEFRRWWESGWRKAMDFGESMAAVVEGIESPLIRELVKRAAEAGFHGGVVALGEAAERFKARL